MKKMLKDVKNDPELHALWIKNCKIEAEIGKALFISSNVLYDAWSEGDDGSMIIDNIESIEETIKQFPLIFIKLIGLRDKMIEYSNKVSK